MVKYLLPIFVIIVATSCNKLEHRLEGKWQLQKIEFEGETYIVDTVWYSFQTSLFEYQLYDASMNKYYNNYGFKTLQEKESTLELELTDYGLILAKDFVVKYTDWNAVKETFRIEEYSRNSLVLKREGKTYVFRKF